MMQPASLRLRRSNNNRLVTLPITSSISRIGTLDQGGAHEALRHFGHELRRVASRACRALR